MFYRQFDDNIDRITLYEKYELVERTEPEVNGVWKGAHLLLFFLAFVFGSFCTFCFHMLMYLFDEKCVLFPKLVSLTSLRQNIIYEFIPDDKDAVDSDIVFMLKSVLSYSYMILCTHSLNFYFIMLKVLPVDFLSTQWVEKSACLLPTYVPLVSGIFGLVWTTMYLMCSIGSRVLTGLQRPWRVLPLVFIFSIVMGGVCVYTSAVTHHGLQELCVKLNEITGSSSCSYTINVATLAYQRRIRGVYQATRLTIISAWLHTACWLLSALLALARVLLAVDFKLVRVSVQLQGNIDRMLERHEKQIRTVSPAWTERTSMSIPQRSHSSIRTHFIKKLLRPNFIDGNKDGDLLYYTHSPREMSESALVTTERLKLDKLAAVSAAPEEHQFIVEMLHDLLDTADGSQYLDFSSGTSFSGSVTATHTPPLTRQYGQLRISSTLASPNLGLSEITSADIQQAEELAQEINRQLHARLNKELNESKLNIDDSPKQIPFKSSLMTASVEQLAIDKNTTTEIEQDPTNVSEPSKSKGKGKILKSSLKQAGVQTDEKVKNKSHIVKIDSQADVSEPKTSQDKETQTKKEKQD